MSVNTFKAEVETLLTRFPNTSLSGVAIKKSLDLTIFSASIGITTDIPGLFPPVDKVFIPQIERLIRSLPLAHFEFVGAWVLECITSNNQRLLRWQLEYRRRKHGRSVSDAIVSVHYSIFDSLCTAFHNVTTLVAGIQGEESAEQAAIGRDCGTSKIV